MSPTPIYTDPLPDWALSFIGTSFLVGFPLACMFGGAWWLSVLPLAAMLVRNVIWACLIQSGRCPPAVE